MVTLNIGEIEFPEKCDIVATLFEIANAVESGYRSGITIGGVCWDIEGQWYSLYLYNLFYNGN